MGNDALKNKKEIKAFSCWHCGSNRVDVMLRETNFLNPNGIGLDGKCRNCGKNMMIYDGSLVNGKAVENPLIMSFSEDDWEYYGHPGIISEHIHQIRCSRCNSNKNRILVNLTEKNLVASGICENCGAKFQLIETICPVHNDYM